MSKSKRFSNIIGWKNNPKNKRYKIMEDYFDNVNTEKKAYFLGLLYADGSNNDKQICISLAVDDKGILEQFCHELYKDDSPLRYVRSNDDNHSDIASLTICNKHIVNILSKAGMIRSKTRKLRYPKNLNPSLHNHFIRGYFDGDGSIMNLFSIDKRRGNYIKRERWVFSIVGTDPFLKTIVQIMKDDYSINIKNKLYNTSSKFCKELKVSNKKSLLKIYGMLYNGATAYMERKRIKWDLFISKIRAGDLKIKKDYSQYKWITFDKARNKWKVMYRNRNLGRFNTEDIALKMIMRIAKCESWQLLKE